MWNVACSVKMFRIEPSHFFIVYFNRAPFDYVPTHSAFSIDHGQRHRICVRVFVLEQQHFSVDKEEAFVKHLMSQPGIKMLSISLSCECVINSESNLFL